jgi:hypothetical protein
MSPESATFVAISGNQIQPRGYRNTSNCSQAKYAPYRIFSPPMFIQNFTRLTAMDLYFTPSN